MMNSHEEKKDPELEAKVRVRECEYQISKQLEQIEELQKEINDKRKQIKRNNLKARQIQTETTHICDENYRISTDIDLKEKLIQSEKVCFDEKQKKLNELREKYMSLKYANNDIKSKIEMLQEYIKESTKTVNETTNNIKNFKMKQKELQCENYYLKEKLSIINRLSNETADIKNHTESVDQKRGHISNQIMVISEEIKTNQETKRSMRKELSKLKEREKEYRSDIDKHSTTNKGRIFSKEDVNDVKEQLSLLKKKLLSLESENSALSMKIASLNHSNTADNLISCKQQTETLKYLKPQSDAESLTQEMKEMQYKICKADSEKNDIETALQNIKDENDELKSKIEESRQLYINIQNHKSNLLAKKQSIIEASLDQSAYSLRSQTEELKKRVYLFEQPTHK